MAFNVERKGVLKLMQGQRRSFEQLGRGGSLVQLQRGASACQRQRPQAPKSPALGAAFGGRGGSSPWAEIGCRDGCAISARACLSATASRRDFFDGTPPRRRDGHRPSQHCLLTAQPRSHSFSPLAANYKAEGSGLPPVPFATRIDRLPTSESQCDVPAEPEPEPHGARSRRWRRSSLWACIRP